MECKSRLIAEELRIQRLNEATALFEARQYAECVKTLEAVEKEAVENDRGDLRLQHNLVIARFFAGGAREPISLLDALSVISEDGGVAADEAVRKEEAARADAIAASSAAQTATKSDNGKRSSGAKGSPDTSRKAKESGKESQLTVPEAMSILVEDTDTIVSNALAEYNIALVDFSLKHFASALERLEGVFCSITRLPEYLVCNVCFLLLDTHLALADQHPEYRGHVLQETGDILAHLDRAFPNLLKKAPSKKGSKESKGTISFPTGRKPVDPVSFKYLHHIYRAKIYLCSESMKQAKREIKWCMSVGNQNPTSMFLKSNLEYQGKNYSKSIKLLNAFHGTDLDTSLPSLYYNNLGCVHYGMGKIRAAEHYFHRALVENEAIYRKESPASDSKEQVTIASEETAKGLGKERQREKGKEEGSSNQGEREVTLGRFARDRKTAILYNNGLLQLRSGSAALAFECFLGAMPLYSKNPWLWLRLAECCIVEHVGLEEKERKESGSVSLVGEGSERMALLPTSGGLDWRNSDLGCGSKAAETDGIFREGLGLKGNPFGVMSLAYAEICLSTCMQLIEESDADGSTGRSSDRASKLRLCVLANLCFVSLACGCPQKTLAWAEKVFALAPSVGNSFVALVYMYAAEAHCLLNRGEAAKSALEVLLKSDAHNSMALASQGANGKAFVDDVRYAMLHNLAVTCAMMGSLESARSHLSSAALICPTSRLQECLRLQAYLELAIGRSSAALSLLRRGRLAGNSHKL